MSWGLSSTEKIEMLEKSLKPNKPKRLTNAERAAIQTQDQVVKWTTIAVTLVIAAFIVGVTIGRGSC